MVLSSALESVLGIFSCRCVDLRGIAGDGCYSCKFVFRLLVREAKHTRVVTLSKPHGIFSVCRLLEQDLCRDLLLKFPERDLAGERSVTLKATVLKMDE